MDADEWNARYDQRELIWSAEPNEFVKAHTVDLDPGRALDLGCGEGRNGIWLAEQGWTVVATDFSDVAIAKAEALADHRNVVVDFRVEDAAAVAHHDGLYDLIVIAYLHLETGALSGVIAAAAGQLADNGTLLIVGHHVENPVRGHGGPPEPSILYDPESIAASLGDLHIVSAGEVHRTVPTETGEATAIDALILANRRAAAAH